MNRKGRSEGDEAAMKGDMAWLRSWLATPRGMRALIERFQPPKKFKPLTKKPQPFEVWLAEFSDRVMRSSLAKLDLDDPQVLERLAGLCAELGENRVEQAILQRLADRHAAGGDATVAIAPLERLVRLQLNDPDIPTASIVASSLQRLVDLHERNGDTTHATWLQVLVDLQQPSGKSNALGDSLERLAYLAGVDHDRAAAARALQRLVDLYEQSGDTPRAIAALQGLVDTLEQDDELDALAVSLQRLADLARAKEYTAVAVRALQRLVDLLQVRGDIDALGTLRRQLVGVQERSGDLHAVADSLQHLAGLDKLRHVRDHLAEKARAESEDEDRRAENFRAEDMVPTRRAEDARVESWHAAQRADVAARWVGATEVIAPDVVPADTAGVAPPPRYASVALFQETRSGEKGAPFATDEVFQEDRWCLAEVSIEVSPTFGVPPAGEVAPIREPYQQQPVQILVIVETQDFDVSPQVAQLTLPPTGDSTQPAVFRLKPRRASSAAEPLLRARFQLLFQLNLLQVLILRGGALPKIQYEDEVVSWRLAAPDLRRIVQTDANDFDRMRPCALHVHVDAKGPNYDMTFTMEQGPRSVVIPARVRITDDQLAGELAGARKTLFGISSSDHLGRQLNGEAGEHAEHLAALTERGRRLWTLLFDRGTTSDISTVGQWLKENPPPERSTIQISVDESAASFAFPWNLLYDQAGSEPSHLGFWGMRYVIEQLVIRPKPITCPAPDIEVAAMYWRFKQVPNHQATLKQLVDSSKRARWSEGTPIDEAKTAGAAIASGRSHVLYFFTHGYTGTHDEQRCGVTVEDFVRLYKALPTGSGTKEAWKYIAESIQDRQFQSDSSWIELTSGKLLLDELYRNVRELPLRPIVILNMCDSAQVTPSLSLSFIDFFLTRGARAVVGTECSVRPVFVDFVGRELFGAILNAQPLGEALRAVRVEAAENRNLLGLAYTLFGAADATV
jgi:hypothetical protein